MKKKKLQTYLRYSKQEEYIHFHHENLKYRYVTIKIHSNVSKLQKVRLKIALKSMPVWNISRSSRGRAFHNLGAATWKDYRLV